MNALLLAKEGKSQETEKMIARVALPNIARPGAWVMIQELRADR